MSQKTVEITSIKNEKLIVGDRIFKIRDEVRCALNFCSVMRSGKNKKVTWFNGIIVQIDNPYDGGVSFSIARHGISEGRWVSRVDQYNYEFLQHINRDWDDEEN